MAPARGRPRSSTTRFFDDAARARPRSTAAACACYFHEAGLLEELRYRLQHPAALLIVLPNGLVKLINALPFVCGDLRTQIARRDLGATSAARGSDPRVARFVDELAADPGKTRTLHQWVHL